MARSLNCVQGPTSHPCGECASCISLAPGGPGNLDVTGLDAASHNSVEDMRELRERAYYAPAASRYRIMIIDEAHVVTNQGLTAQVTVPVGAPDLRVLVVRPAGAGVQARRSRAPTPPDRVRVGAPEVQQGLLERAVAGEG